MSKPEDSDKLNCDESDLEEWTKMNQIQNERLSRIYKDLCEYDETINAQECEEDTEKIFELIEMIKSIQSTASKLRPACSDIKTANQALRQQMNLLENTMGLLRLQQEDNINN